jgi:hypothetical protein
MPLQFVRDRRLRWNEGVVLREMLAEAPNEFYLKLQNDIDVGLGIVQEATIGMDDLPSIEGVNQVTIRREWTAKEGPPDPFQIQYLPIYQEIEDANFPQTINDYELGPASAVMVEIKPGGEVKFGTIGSSSKTVPILLYGVGFEVQKQVLDFNQTWVLSQMSLGLGRSYNIAMNNVHFYPILNGSYNASSPTKAKQETQAQHVAYDTNLQTTLESVLKILPLATWLFIGSSNKFRVANVLNTVYTDTNTPIELRKNFDMTRVVAYDGGTITVGAKTTTYDGVGSTYGYALVPKQNFRSYIKRRLTVEEGDGDLSRFIAFQQVAHAYQGVSATLPGQYGVVKFAFA